MKRSSLLALPFLFIAQLFSAKCAVAAPLSGLSFGIELGGRFGMSRDYLSDWPDSEADDGNTGIEESSFEGAQIAYDTGPAKLGIHLEEVTVLYGRRESAGGVGSNSNVEPVWYASLEFDVCVMPFRFVRHGTQHFQPYIGVGVGGLINTDSDHDFLSNELVVPVRVGAEYYLSDWHVVGIDVAYHISKADWSHATIMLVYRFRIPFTKMHQHDEVAPKQSERELVEPL